MAAGHEGFPYVRDLLLGPAYLLLLPAIASLDTRHRALVRSGATLGTLAGAGSLLLGMLGVLVVDAQPAALFALGMWWWTVGKLWATSEIFSRPLGTLTLLLAPLAFLAAVASAGYGPLSAIAGLDAPERSAWELSRPVVTLWTAALAAALWRAGR